MLAHCSEKGCVCAVWQVWVWLIWRGVMQYYVGINFAFEFFLHVSFVLLCCKLLFLYLQVLFCFNEYFTIFCPPSQGKKMETFWNQFIVFWQCKSWSQPVKMVLNASFAVTQQITTNVSCTRWSYHRWNKTLGPPFLTTSVSLESYTEEIGRDLPTIKFPVGHEIVLVTHLWMTK